MTRNGGSKQSKFLENKFIECLIKVLDLDSSGQNLGHELFPEIDQSLINMASLHITGPEISVKRLRIFTTMYK